MAVLTGSKATLLCACCFLLLLAGLSFAVARYFMQRAEDAADLATVSLEDQTAQGASKEFFFDGLADYVVHCDPSGVEIWSVPFKGFRRHSDPGLVWDAERVYVAQIEGVTALDAKSGRVQWHSKGPADRLFLSRDLLLAVNGVSATALGEEGRLLLARSVQDGVEVFRVALPREDSNPLPIKEVAALFLVQGEGYALFITRQGKVRHRLTEPVVDGFPLGEDLIVLTGSQVLRLSPADKVRWSAPFGHDQFSPGGKLLVLNDGDVLASLYGSHNDSGVDLMRVRVATGAVVWQAACHPFGVTHSKYRHRAMVRVQSDQVRVISCGDGGSWVEARDLGSGHLLHRRKF